MTDTVAEQTAQWRSPWMGLTVAAMLSRLIISWTGTTRLVLVTVFYATALSKAKLSSSLQLGTQISGMSTVGWIKQRKM